MSILTWTQILLTAVSDDSIFDKLTVRSKNKCNMILQICFTEYRIILKFFLNVSISKFKLKENPNIKNSHQGNVNIQRFALFFFSLLFIFLLNLVVF